MSGSLTAEVPRRPDASDTRSVRQGRGPSGLVSELRQIWDEFVEYRFLLYQLALRDIRIRYKQAVMGFFWAVFMPALIVLAGMLVKFAMAYLSGTSMNTDSIGKLAVKAIAWAFFVGAIGFGSTSLTSNVQLVTKIYFPRQVLPVATTLAQTFDSTVGAVALALILPFLGMTFSTQLLWVPLLMVMLMAFTAGVSLFLAFANLFFRDVKYIVATVLRFGIFFTPVFFEPAMFGPKGARILMLNPVSPYLEGLRLSIIDGHNLLTPVIVTDSAGMQVLEWTPWYLLYGAVAAFVALSLGAILFHRLEHVFAEYA